MSITFHVAEQPRLNDAQRDVIARSDAARADAQRKAELLHGPDELAIAIQKATLGAKSPDPAPPADRPGRMGTMAECMAHAEQERQRIGLRSANSMHAARAWLEQQPNREALVLALARLLDELDELRANAAGGSDNE